MRIKKIQPFNDRVLLKPDEKKEETTRSGLIIPPGPNHEEAPLTGTILAVGPGSKDDEMLVAEGDHVMYGKFAGSKIELFNDDGLPYEVLILRQGDIVGKITELVDIK